MTVAAGGNPGFGAEPDGPSGRGLSIRTALEGVVETLSERDLVVGTTGYTCRWLQEVRDRPGNFYMIGSMGLAGVVGLGLALTAADRRVVVLDGDGALLMGLGSLPMIGTSAPKNLVHVVLDNESFASTGGQATCSGKVPLEALAREAGYPRVVRVEIQQELKTALRGAGRGQGPVFILIKLRPEDAPAPERVRIEPQELTRRLMRHIHEEISTRP